MKLSKLKFVFVLIFLQFSFLVNCQDNSNEEEAIKKSAPISKVELIQKLKKVETDTYETEIYSGFFNSEVKVQIQKCSNENDAFKVSDCLLQRINDFIVYGGSEKNKILSDIFSDYKYNIQETFYGMVPDELIKKHNNNYEKANQEYFNIYTKEEAFKALNFKYALFIDCAPVCKISESSGYYVLVFERPWDDENQLEVEFENGKYKELF